MRGALVLVCASCSFHPGTAVAPPTTDGATGAADAAGPGSDARIIPGDGAPAGWWNPAWPYRIPLSITDSVALPSAFEVGFSIDLDSAPCAGSRDGVRVVFGTTELPRVIDETGAPQWIWFRLQAPLAANATATGYWLYCGNPNPDAAPSDPGTVFQLYDGFSGTSLGSTWPSAGTISVANGVATLQNGSTFHSAMTFPMNTAVDFSLAPQGTAPSMYFWGGFQNGTATTGPWVIWNTRNETGIHPEVTENATNVSYGNSMPYDTSFHLYGVESYGATSMFRSNDVSVGSVARATTGAMSVRFDNYNSGANTIQVDWVRVRHAANPPPTVTVGAPEMY